MRSKCTSSMAATAGMPRPKSSSGDDEEVIPSLNHTREYYYERLVVTGEQLRHLTKTCTSFATGAQGHGTVFRMGSV
eukprot:1051331-Pyramimonas_sp.AAC.1